MQILRFQTAAFFMVPAERPDLLPANMPHELLELFDRIPIIPPLPPIPENVPNVSDFPIVTLQSSRLGYQGTISKKRADLFYNYSSDKNYSELLQEVSSYAKQFYQYFCTVQQVNRIGFVLSVFIPEENAVKTISNKYSVHDLCDCEELAIRFNRREMVSGIRLNNITNLHSDQVTFGQQSAIPGIIIEYDINNVVQSGVLTDVQCESIFQFAISHYGPEEVKKLTL